MSRIILVTGGRRSGKSRFAETYALRLSESPIYLATGVAVDEEFRERIRHHQMTRDKRFLTREEPLEVASVIRELPSSSVVVWECVTTWLANLFHHVHREFSQRDEETVYARLKTVSDMVREKDHTLLAVTNEIGLGVIPADAISRRYSDVLGRCNQYLASWSEEVYFMVSGIAWRIK